MLVQAREAIYDHRFEAGAGGALESDQESLSTYCPRLGGVAVFGLVNGPSKPDVYSKHCRMASEQAF